MRDFKRRIASFLFLAGLATAWLALPNHVHAQMGGGGGPGGGGGRGGGGGGQSDDDDAKKRKHDQEWGSD